MDGLGTSLTETLAGLCLEGSIIGAGKSGWEDRDAAEGDQEENEEFFHSFLYFFGSFNVIHFKSRLKI